MTYTALTISAIVLTVLIDLRILKTRLLTRKVFWTSYAIILFFQLITNWWLTSNQIVSYSEDFILGARIAAAPIEDLGFGFALVTNVMALWVYWGRRGLLR
ncbi:MAG: lycopene cyclase domain-containing protein [Actinobacteria bacterium]|nr:lycopene cyclase domain-containing protein [Actinomycetota bacterium]